MLELTIFALLFIFWKPIYYTGRYFYHKYYTKDDKFINFAQYNVNFFTDFWKLVW